MPATWECWSVPPPPNSCQSLLLVVAGILGDRLQCPGLLAAAIFLLQVSPFSFVEYLHCGGHKVIQYLPQQ